MSRGVGFSDHVLLFYLLKEFVEGGTMAQAVFTHSKKKLADET